MWGCPFPHGPPWSTKTASTRASTGRKRERLASRAAPSTAERNYLEGRSAIPANQRKTKQNLTPALEKAIADCRSESPRRRHE
eukprot:10487548-Alexandrium_andersonii.AAC.1